MSSLPEGWLEMAFIRDDRAELVESIQGRQFLRGGIPPTVGQRVDLTLNLANRQGKRPNVNMSGFVTRVLPEPTSYYPQTSQDDREGSMMLSQLLGHGQFRPSDEIPEGMEFHACPCPEPECQGGMMFMPRNVWDEVSAETSPTHCLYQHNVVRFAQRNTGAKHGQQVVCEARLHFDHDIRRGNADGPWGDEIPFNGQDVWQFTLVLDDHLQNFWVAKPDSFVNLGSNRHVRCWPWSSDTELPYDYDGVDRDDIHDNYMVTLCIGPFGCPGADHPHDYAGAA